MFWLILIGSAVALRSFGLLKFRWELTPKPPEPKPTFWQYVSYIIVALCILDMMKTGIEADPLRCNRLNAKPPLAGYLTCQRTYHYQPDPFTG
jgi:hypothetical protein